METPPFLWVDEWVKGMGSCQITNNQINLDLIDIIQLWTFWTFFEICTLHHRSEPLMGLFCTGWVSGSVDGLDQITNN